MRGRERVMMMATLAGDRDVRMRVVLVVVLGSG